MPSPGPAGARPGRAELRGDERGDYRGHSQAPSQCAGSRFPYAALGARGDRSWLELADGIHLFLAFEGSTALDTGFELLAAVGELAVPRIDDARFSAYAQLLSRELAEGATGEIDEDAFAARRSATVDYTAVSLASTIAEYAHALWHDVELRQGPEHLVRNGSAAA